MISSKSKSYVISERLFLNHDITSWKNVLEAKDAISLCCGISILVDDSKLKENCEKILEMINAVSLNPDCL